VLPKEGGPTIPAPSPRDGWSMVPKSSRCTEGRAGRTVPAADGRREYMGNYIREYKIILDFGFVLIYH
jgi:hypothetical protein